MVHDRQNVKELIRGLVLERGSVSSSDIQRAAEITRQAVNYHLRAMVETGELESTGKGPAVRYHAPSRLTTRYQLRGLAEDRVWTEIWGSAGHLRTLPENVVSILRYALTEMVNNAIDHSHGTSVELAHSVTDHRLWFEVTDDGIGAFRSVRTKLDLPDNFAALQQISKGKTTTAPDRHTGEGIFFTSKAVDRFVLEANALRWTVDNLVGDQAAADGRSGRGTRVWWELDSRSERVLGDIFGNFTDAATFEFSRSRAVVRLFKTGESFVSRSEAKRMAEGLERFREVEIDFSGVTEVGQGFVDELFRVWRGGHPDTRLLPANMSPAVEAMVRRGLPAG